jgi:hypothetical protein
MICTELADVPRVTGVTMSDPERDVPARVAGRKAAIKALAALRNPHPVGTDKYHLWRQGIVDVMHSLVASWELQQARLPRREGQKVQPCENVR